MKKISLALFIIFFTTSASAKTTDEKVSKFVEQVGNQIIDVAGEKISEDAKREKIITIVDNNIDSKWISRFVLSKNYRTANDDQRIRFRKLYREFMINTYGPKFKDYNGRKFTVGEVSKRRSFYLVKAEFLQNNSDVPVSINFRVKEKKDKLVILDFIAEGVSLIETQRSEFNSAISQNGMDNFLNILEKRVAKLKKVNP